jgi:hypothetical protein
VLRLSVLPRVSEMHRSFHIWTVSNSHRRDNQLGSNACRNFHPRMKGPISFAFWSRSK